MSNFPVEDALKPECDALRADLKAIEDRVRKFYWSKIVNLALDFEELTAEPGNEITDSTKMAIRHIEDARMRIGKVLQYARDGVSCFDHTKETP